MHSLPSDFPIYQHLRIVRLANIFKAFEGGVHHTDSPQQTRARTLTQAAPDFGEDLGDVKLVVQSFDAEMPADLTWDDTWQAGGQQQVEIWQILDLVGLVTPPFIASIKGHTGHKT